MAYSIAAVFLDVSCRRIFRSGTGQGTQNYTKRYINQSKKIQHHDTWCAGYHCLPAPVVCRVSLDKLAVLTHWAEERMLYHWLRSLILPFTTDLGLGLLEPGSTGANRFSHMFDITLRSTKHLCVARPHPDCPAFAVNIFAWLAVDMRSEILRSSPKSFKIPFLYDRWIC